MLSNDNIFPLVQSEKLVFVSIDTAAGGNRSGYTVMSCIYPTVGLRNKAVIIGAEFGQPKSIKKNTSFCC